MASRCGWYDGPKILLTGGEKRLGGDKGHWVRVIAEMKLKGAAFDRSWLMYGVWL